MISLVIVVHYHQYRQQAFNFENELTIWAVGDIDSKAVNM